MPPVIQVRSVVRMLCTAVFWTHGVLTARDAFGLAMARELDLNRGRLVLAPAGDVGLSLRPALDVSRRAGAAEDGADRRRGISFGDAPAPAPGKDDTPGGLLRGISLGLGPVRWRAVTSTELRTQTASDGRRTSGLVSSANASAATYVYQPWLAQVRGGIGFVRSSSRGSEGSDSKSLSLTGEGGVSLFPASRFPFDASFSVSDSRASGEVTGSDFRTTRMGVRQAYRTLDGTQYSARFERSMISGATFGSDVLDVMEGTYSKRFGAHAVEVSGNHSSNAGGANGTQSSLLRFNGRDSFTPRANLQVETLATFNQNAFEQNSSALRNNFSTQFMQLASFVNWRPVEGEPLFDEDHPVVVTGGVRFSGVASEGGGTQTESQSASASAGVNYTIAPETRLSAGGTVTQQVSGGSGAGLSTSQNVTISHAPMPIPLGAFQYSWNANVGASNSSGNSGGSTGGSPTPTTVSASRQSVNGQGSHVLSRIFPLSERSGITVSVSQSAGATLASGGGTQNLTHNATAIWTLLGETTGQTYVSVNASDMRNFGAVRGDFQLFNVQATRQAPTGPMSFWTANLTVQGARQNLQSDTPLVSPTSNGGFNVNTTGGVTYQHLRFLGTPRLRLFASYMANQAQLQSRALGDIEAPREIISGVLDARLDYKIGKVEARLSFRSANVDHKRNSLLFLRITRNF